MNESVGLVAWILLILVRFTIITGKASGRGGVNVNTPPPPISQRPKPPPPPPSPPQ